MRQDLTERALGTGHRYAGIWPRSLALAIDLALLFALFLPITRAVKGGKGTGAGAGGGVKLEPAALIIAREGEISVVGIQAKRGKLEALLEMIPETVERLMQAKGKKAGEEEEKAEE